MLQGTNKNLGSILFSAKQPVSGLKAKGHFLGARNLFKSILFSLKSSGAPNRLKFSEKALPVGMLPVSTEGMPVASKTLLFGQGPETGSVIKVQSDVPSQSSLMAILGKLSEKVKSGRSFSFQLQTPESGKVSVAYDGKTKELIIKPEEEGEILSLLGADFLSFVKDLNIPKLRLAGKDGVDYSVSFPDSGQKPGYEVVNRAGLAAKVTDLAQRFTANQKDLTASKDNFILHKIAIDETGEADLELRHNGSKVDITLKLSKGIPVEQVKPHLQGLLKSKQVPVGKLEIVPAESKGPVPGKVSVAHKVPVQGKGPVPVKVPVSGKVPVAGEVPVSGKVPVTGKVPVLVQEPVLTDDDDTLETIKTFVETLRKSGSKGNSEVAVVSDKFGKISVASAKTSEGQKVEIGVTTTKARDWLQQKLVAKGITVEDIKIVSARPLATGEPVLEAELLSDKSIGAGRRVSKTVESEIDSIMKEVDASPELSKHRTAIVNRLNTLTTDPNQPQTTGLRTEPDAMMDGVEPEVEQWLNARIQKLLKTVSGEAGGETPAVRTAEAVEHVADKTDKKVQVGKNSMLAAENVKSEKANTPGETGNEFNENTGKNQTEADKLRFGKVLQSTTAGEKSETIAHTVSQSGSNPPSTVANNTSGAASAVSFEFVNGKLVAQPQIETGQMAEMIQKISEMVERNASVSGQKLEVQMDVDGMGRVSVDAARQMDKIHLQIQVDSHDVRRMMENQVKPMLEQLARDGVDVGKLDVSVRDQRSDGLKQEFGQGNQRFNESLDQQEQRGSSPRYVNEMLDQQLRQTGGEDTTVEIWV